MELTKLLKIGTSLVGITMTSAFSIYTYDTFSKNRKANHEENIRDIGYLINNIARRSEIKDLVNNHEISSVLEGRYKPSYFKSLNEN